jgi:hypothetical protein
MPSRLQLEAGTLQGALEQFLGPAAEPAAQSPAELLNPTNHPAPVTVLQQWSRRAVEELAKNGFAHFRRFSVLPSRKAPRWLLPLDDGHRMLQGFQMYTPNAWSGAMLKATVTGFIKAGWNGWGRPRVLIASRQRLPLEKLVSEVTGEPELTFSMSLGFGGNFRKLTVQVMRPNGAILGYIKLPLTESATERIRHEAAILERLWNFPALRPHIPKVLYACEWAAGGFLLFQSAGPHCPGPVEFGRLHEVFLRTLGGGYRAEKPGRMLVEEVAACWQKRVSLMDAELQQLGKEALERASRELDGSMVPCGVSQGDFTPWNTRIEHERLFVFDWESAAWDAPILWDRFHFHIQVVSLLNKNSGGWDPSSQTRMDRASFLLYLLSSVCQCLEEAGSGDPGTEYRKRILLRELS